MSLRATSETIAREILDAWFSERVRPEELACIQQVREIEHKYGR